MTWRRKAWLSVSFCVTTLAVILAASSQAVAQTSKREFIYTINFSDDAFPLANVSGFSLDLDTGEAKEVPGSPFSSSTPGPVSITNSPDGRFVYVGFNLQFLGGPCGSNGELISFGVDPHTGALTQIDTVTLSGVCSTGVTVDPTGKFVYAASFGGGEGPKVGLIDGFQTDNGHLMPLPGTPFASTIAVPDGQNPAIQNLAITPDGKVLYASNPNDARGVLIFERDTKTGALAFRTAVNSGSGFGALALTPSGRFLLAPGGIPSSGQPGMFEFAIGEHGDLTPAAGSPFPLPPGSGNLAISPDGELVAVLGNGISTLHEAAHGRLALTPGSPFGDITAAAISFDPSGKFVLVPGTVFRVRPGTGALSEVSEFAGAGPDGITVLRTCVRSDEDRDGKHEAGDKRDGDRQDDGCHEPQGQREQGTGNREQVTPAQP